MLDVVLVRHGETDENLSSTLQGQSPWAGRLTERGRRQAQAAGRALRGEVFDAAFASPLERAVITLALILIERGAPMPLAFPEDLREIDMGALVGEPRHAWLAGAARAPQGDPCAFRPEGGESWDDVQARAAGAFAGLVRDGAGQLRRGRLLVVAHGGVNRGILTALCGLPMAMGWSGPDGDPLDQANGCINRIRLDDAGQPASICANDTRHLAGLLPDRPSAGVTWDAGARRWTT